MPHKMLSSYIAIISESQEEAVEMRNEGKPGNLPPSWNRSSWERLVPTAWLCCVLKIRVHKHSRRRKAVGVALPAPSWGGTDRGGCLQQRFLYEFVVSKVFSLVFFKSQSLGRLTQVTAALCGGVTSHCLVFIHGPSVIYLLLLSKALFLSSWLN